MMAMAVTAGSVRSASVVLMRIARIHNRDDMRRIKLDCARRRIRHRRQDAQGQEHRDEREKPSRSGEPTSHSAHLASANPITTLRSNNTSKITKTISYNTPANTCSRNQQVSEIQFTPPTLIQVRRKQKHAQRATSQKKMRQTRQPVIAPGVDPAEPHKVARPRTTTSSSS